MLRCLNGGGGYFSFFNPSIYARANFCRASPLNNRVAFAVSSPSGLYKTEKHNPLCSGGVTIKYQPGRLKTSSRLFRFSPSLWFLFGSLVRMATGPFFIGADLRTSRIIHHAGDNVNPRINGCPPSIRGITYCDIITDFNSMFFLIIFLA